MKYVFFFYFYSCMDDATDAFFTFDRMELIHATNDPYTGFDDLATNCKDDGANTYCNINGNGGSVKMAKGMWKIYVQYAKMATSNALVR